MNLNHWIPRGFKAFASFGLVALLVACASPSKPRPAELTGFTALVPARLVWSSQIGASHALLVPAAHGSALFLANEAGSVAAIDTRTGHEIWRADVGTPLVAGVGTDGESVAVVTRENNLVVLGKGQERWRARLDARVFTPPLVAGRRVFVLAGDRSVSAYDGQTGAKLWVQQARSNDALVLQQQGVLLAAGNTLLAGVSGRLVGLNPLNGRVLWEAPVARPRGVNEIERLVDLVGPVGRVDSQVCARAFQAAVGCVDVTNAAVLWTQPATGAVGVDADEDRVYGSESNGRVQAWRRDTGMSAWRTDRLLHRGLTAPLVVGRSLVVGDAEGFVHLLSREDGSLLNRLSTDGSPVIAAPVLAGNTLVAVTRKGGVFAWRPE